MTRGLFSSVLHVRDVARDDVLDALDGVMREAGFAHRETLPVSAAGPYSLLDSSAMGDNGPCYLVSPLRERWLAMIEARFPPPGASQLVELGNLVSARLSTYALTLILHDDDVFYYNLDRNGKALDGYNSFPQYFEQERLSEAEIASQRHQPDVFAPLLSADSTMIQLKSLLQRGWWQAHDAGTLDEDGVPVNDEEFVDEPGRMTALGTLLRLHGGEGDYPFTAWGQSPDIAWPEFLAIEYRPLG